MIRRLLIANRGEIALRIVRACRELGHRERRGLFRGGSARAARASPPIARSRSAPSPPARELPQRAGAARRRAAIRRRRRPSRLRLPVRARRTSRAPASTPGSTFVGPPPDAIERMGSKIGARRLMEAAGVPIVPGETPADQSDASLIAAVNADRLPGADQAVSGRRRHRHEGRARRRRDRPTPCSARGARPRRRSATGRLYVERLVERPRHVEIQVFADAHGNVVHLFERECTVQRRHQKVIEESPCPALTPAVRAADGRRGGGGRAGRGLRQRRHGRVPARGRRRSARGSSSSR